MQWGANEKEEEKKKEKKKEKTEETYHISQLNRDPNWPIRFQSWE